MKRLLRRLGESAAADQAPVPRSGRRRPAGPGIGAASAALLLVLAAGGCAAPPGPTTPGLAEPPLPYPPSVRARMMRILVEEWRDWGAPVADPDRPAPQAAAGTEGRPENFPRVLAYWRALDDDEGAVARNRRLYRAALEGRAEGEALWQEPYWSAAFVSYVMRAAGVDRAEFPPAPAHATYVDAMIGAALAHPATAPFLPHEPGARIPAPGDLLCADRSRAPLAQWQDRLAETGRFRPMHCDIVLRAGPGGVEAIGGNVRDAVTLTRYPADAAGYLLPRPAGAPQWFAVFENRLGCLPPWPATGCAAASAQPDPIPSWSPDS